MFTLLVSNILPSPQVTRTYKQFGSLVAMFMTVTVVAKALYRRSYCQLDKLIMANSVVGFCVILLLVSVHGRQAGIQL